MKKEFVLKKESEKSIRLFGFLCMLFMALLFIGAGNVWGELIDPSPGNIQGAVDKAKDGDVIPISSGFLGEEVTISGKKIKFQISFLVIGNSDKNIKVSSDAELEIDIQEGGKLVASYPSSVIIENAGKVIISGEGNISAMPEGSVAVKNHGDMILEKGIKISKPQNNELPIMGNTSNITAEGTYLKETTSSWEVASIFNQSASLDAQVALNIYAAYNYKEGDEVKAVFSSDIFAEDIVKEAEGEPDATYGYKFSVGVPAKNMGNSINVKLLVNDIEICETTTSIKEYGEKIASGTDKNADIAKAMLHYGAKAQEYFGVEGNKIDENITFDKPGVSITSNFEMPEGTSEISYYGSSLILMDKIILRHYFKLDDQNVENYVFTVDGEEVIPTHYAENSKYYYIDIKNISADKLGDVYTIIVKKVDDKVIEFNYGAYDYVYRALNDDDAKLVALCKAVYYYGCAVSE